MIELTIPGEPKSQLRPRAARRGNKVIMYDPKTVKDYKAYVSAIAKQNAPQNPLEGALGVKIKFYRPIPKSTSKKRREAMNAGIERPIVKPDTDNFTKAVLDSLNNIIYKDDSQIVGLWAEKYYSDNPCTKIEITEVF